MVMTPAPHDAGAGVADLLPDRDPHGRPVRVSVLSRAGCHLCARAVGAVEQVCASLRDVGYAEVDIDQAAAADPQVRARYGEWVPVVFVDGTMHDYFTVDPERLRESLTSS
jgi:glutaredoxin